MAKAWLVNFGIRILVQVRLHILLQLDGLAEWMPAMAEQVSALLPVTFLKAQIKTHLAAGSTFQCIAVILYDILVYEYDLLLCSACVRRVCYAPERGYA